MDAHAPRAIAVLPGDGIGPEVMDVALEVLERAAALHGSDLRFTTYPWSCAYYAQHGRMMPEDGLETLRAYDAILLGAVGFPGVPDHVSLWELLLPIRRGFDEYVNLRPVRRLTGMPQVLARAADVDFVVVRENSEGEYSQIGGRLFEGEERETVLQTAVFSRHGVDRILRYAFALARTRRHHLVAATKSNGIFISMPYWDSRVRTIAAEFPDVAVEIQHADALAARFLLRPESLDVVVASNLFGDILSDLGSALTGSLGLAPSANLNPEGTAPSLFEPVHGSAPDIAGKGIANPLGQVSSAAMMLRHLGLPDLAADIDAAVAAVLREGVLTPDLGGTASTRDVAAHLLQALKGPARS